MLDLSIIIVSWNVAGKLQKNLKAIFESEIDFTYEVFVVDNNSKDNTIEVIKKEFPQVNLIINEKNYGFAKANNQAIKKSGGKFILLLNPDMRVEKTTLARMLAWMSANNQAWAAGCRLVSESGKTIKQVRKFPTLADQLAIVLKLPHAFPNVLDNYILKKFNYSKAAKVDSIRGGFFMIRKDAVEKIGLLDERFFLWFEEVDYCQRIYKKGGEVWYTPAASCIDYIGQSFKQVPRKTTQKYFKDSMLKYFKKWKPYWQYMFLKFAWLLALIPTNLTAMMNYKPKAKT